LPVADVRLFTEQWGEGKPVAFVHGLGASARYWERLRDAGTGYHGIAVDLLGFGRSPAPADAAYDVDCHVAVLGPMVAPGSIVVAHSTGALLAGALADRFPGRVRRLLLLGLPAFPDETTARAEVGRLGTLARLTVAGSPFARAICEAMCRIRPLAVAVAPFLIRDLPPSIASDAARHTWVSYHRTLDAVVVRYRPLEDLAAAAVPITLVHGTEDRTAPPELLRPLADELIARGCAVDVRLVPGDHHLAVRRPEQVAAVLAELLDTPHPAP